MGDSEPKHVGFLKGRTENTEEKHIAASPKVLEQMKGSFGLGACPLLFFVEKQEGANWKETSRKSNKIPFLSPDLPREL